MAAWRWRPWPECGRI